MPGSILSANHSNVLIDGEVIAGLQSITFKNDIATESVYNIGSDERIDVNFGPKKVTGTLAVRSYDKKLDDMIAEKKPFQIVAKLKQKGIKEGQRTVSLDEVVLEGKDFEMQVNGVAQITYRFTATRVREE